MTTQALERGARGSSITDADRGASVRSLTRLPQTTRRGSPPTWSSRRTPPPPSDPVGFTAEKTPRAEPVPPDRADYVHMDQELDVSEDGHSATPTRFGLPVDAFARAWRITDIASYLGLERSAAYRLMRDPDAPPRLRTGSTAYRWDGEQVMAWVRHMDWVEVHTSGASQRTTTQSHQRTARPSADRRGVPPAANTPDRPRDVSVRRTSGGPPRSSTETALVPDGPTVHVVDPAAAQQRAAASQMESLVGPRSLASTRRPRATRAPRAEGARLPSSNRGPA